MWATWAAAQGTKEEGAQNDDEKNYSGSETQPRILPRAPETLDPPLHVAKEGDHGSIFG
jgi:hypothetical protein